MAAAESKKKTEFEWGVWLASWRLWAFPVGVGLFVAVSFLAVALPQIQALFSLRGDVKEAQQKLSALSQKRRFLESWEDDQMEAQVETVTAVLPNAKPVFAVLQSLEGQAAVSGVAVSGYTITPGALDASSSANKKQAKPGEMQQLALKVTVEGQLETINQYLRDLEQLAPLIEVEKVKVSKLRKADSEVTHQAELGVLSYYSVPLTSLGKTATVLKPRTDEQDQLLEKLASYRQFQSLVDVNEGAVSGKTDLFSF